MAELSALSARLVRARNVETCARMSVEGLSDVLGDVAAGLFLERREGRLSLCAGNDIDPQASASFEAQALGVMVAQESGRQAIGPDTSPLQCLAIPLVTRSKPFGALVVARDRYPFNEHETRILELLAHSTAVAIENARLYQETRRLAITDPTTRLHNFRYFRATLIQETQKARRFRYPVALLMADIDHFKQFNDTYGHPKGNLALQAISRALVRSLRQTDTVARYGGEEFAAILPGCDRASLATVAEKVRAAVAAVSIRVHPGMPGARLTISLGGACQDFDQLDPGELVSAADRALYRAKEQGRDRFCIWT
jgi:diguanylate cyclase (GGDEF)-like protein